jgi:hypothetical protein
LKKERIMLNDVTKTNLRERLKNDPAERDKFLANTAEYLKDVGVSVPEQALPRESRRSRRGPEPVALLVGGVV